MRRYVITILALLALTSLTACGKNGTDLFTLQTKATVKIMTSGSLPAGTTIGGIDVTLNLPEGVSVKASPDTSNSSMLVTNDGVVTVSGVTAGTSAIADGTYTTNPNSVVVQVASANGFGTGEFVTVICNIKAGRFVSAKDFTATNFYVVDTNGAAINNLTAGMTVNVH